MKHKIIITHYKDGIVTALFHDGKAVELMFTPKEEKGLLGNIYVGKVTNVVKNIRAAFIEIEDRIPCYYPLEKNGNPLFTKKGNANKLTAGDELLVQVSKDAAKTKAPSLTSRLSFSGKYLVLTHGDTKIGFSSKLNAVDRERLAPLLEPFRNTAYGWIVRTNAATAEEKEIREEAERLKQKYETLLAKAMHRPCRTCLYRTPAEYLTQLKNYYSQDYEEILTDDAVLYEEIRDYLREYQPEDQNKLRLYSDRLLPLFKLYSLETAFENALRERVWLKSGGYLVIQPTEALTVIDVNTGKYDGKKNLQETFLKINREAAKETARQLRLRNLSGIIIVDFINMESREHKEQILTLLTEELKKDPKKAVVVDMTPLGLVELTRKREQGPLYERMGKRYRPSEKADEK